MTEGNKDQLKISPIITFVFYCALDEISIRHINREILNHHTNEFHVMGCIKMYQLLSEFWAGYFLASPRAPMIPQLQYCSPGGHETGVAAGEYW
jgi:hypothetical protein